MNLRACLLAACTCLLPVPTVAQADDRPAFRDLNRNGQRDPYEDATLPPEQRVDDLLARMTLAEKVGTMLHANLPTDDPLGHLGKAYDAARAAAMISNDHITSFITRLSVPPREMAEQSNAIQRLAAATRLGIPATISSDPRHHFHSTLGASSSGGGFSTWPETLGLAALQDDGRVRRFADIARREYRAVGIHMALSPQADLATEPRWPRAVATFGSDVGTVSRLAGAYVAGFQGSDAGLTREGVAAVAKHWLGYGAQPGGFDGHNSYGRTARLTDAALERHAAAFDGVLDAHVAGIMPTYVILEGARIKGKRLEPVGAGFNRVILTDMLRGDRAYKGFILSDWAITEDCGPRCTTPTAQEPQRPQDIGMPWGVERLSREQRFAKAVRAGIDQFGGVSDPAPLLAALKFGAIGEAEIDAAARRILLVKFRLGLFDDHFVDPERAAAILGDAQAQAEAGLAQREAQVLLENGKGLLPLRASGQKVWLHGLSADAARIKGLVVVTDPVEADLAIVRVNTPFERIHPWHFFGSRQNEGRLDFRAGDPDYEAIARAARHGPVIVVADLDRPAILTGIRDRAAAILAVFGASDVAVMDVVTGAAAPRGRLPFELPSSMRAVENQKPGLTDDSARPLYPRGYGLMNFGNRN